MLHWIHVNLGSILIVLLLLAVVGGIVRSLIRRKKQGRCSCNCANCAMHGTCHTAKQS